MKYLNTILYFIKKNLYYYGMFYFVAGMAIIILIYDYMNDKSNFLSGLRRDISVSMLLISVLTLSFSCNSSWTIDNPYGSVDWENHSQYKANFHTHTTRSDGWLNPDTVVDLYHALGYDILAITDHNEVTYPWTGFSELDASKQAYNRKENDPESMPPHFNFEDRDPVVLKMIDIEGNEFSRHHHMGSFFNNLLGTSDVMESLEAIAGQDGIVMLNHPGRYNYPIDWYVDVFQNHDHLIGLEVYNQGDRYPDDRLKWDSLLTITMPKKNVWAYSNDDMHSLPHVGRNWNMLVLPELTHESVREGMERGLSYYVYAPQGHSGPTPPVIESIVVNEKKGTIEILATGYESIQWISEGEIIGNNQKLELDEPDIVGNYVRAELSGAGETVAGTQPFSIQKN